MSSIFSNSIKKLGNFLSHRYVMLSIFLLLLFYTSTVFNIIYIISEYNENDLDQILNFSASLKISLGYIPYLDFHLLQTPLFFYLMALFLKIFGQQMIVFVIAGSFFIVLMYYLFYYLLAKIYHNPNSALFITLIIAIYNISNLICFNYNKLIIILIYLTILYEISKYEKKGLPNNFFIGVIFALIFFCKQNVGGVFFATNLLFVFISSETIKNKLIIIIHRVVGFSLVAFIYVTYLYFNDALMPFIDHAFLGMIDFAKYSSTFNVGIFNYYIPGLLILFISLIKLIKQKSNNLSNPIYIIFSYAVGSLIFVYPMFERHNIFYSSAIIFLLIPYLINFHKSKFTSAIYLFILATFIIEARQSVLIIKADNLTLPTSNHYRYLPIEPTIGEDFLRKVDYVKANQQLGRKVEIIDTGALLYLLELGIYDDKYDLTWQGNAGYRGEARMIERVKQEDDNVLFMVRAIDREQDMLGLKQYIVCNYQYIESLDLFDIYQRKTNSENLTTPLTSMPDVRQNAEHESNKARCTK